MFERLLVEHCAPTLAGIKTANLFSYSGDDAMSKVRHWNRLLYKLRLRLTILSNIKKRQNRINTVYRFFDLFLYFISSTILPLQSHSKSKCHQRRRV